MSETQVDVRPVPKPQKHPMIFEAFDALAVGESFVLVNNHDPRHLRDEFERDWAGGYGWEYVERGPVWQIRITRLSAEPPARILGEVTVEAAPDAAGAVWKLQMGRRDPRV
ncbi:DUF2249 domain-containing protein [Actinoplanes sp. TRM 88003]|uniref:DUF2249 domain-containing protein n=1 Tax=Paractinoplanes aksuensis TaxID=2939490 RepID=A0ABT1DKV7_9ACTN|nr:DUF2249 domain-containing protein [Actinoplanes aksuensis]MCO8270401.1 DUF2249 domain-containing protein [Actinoplanes aksuensis]